MVTNLSNKLRSSGLLLILVLALVGQISSPHKASAIYMANNLIDNGVYTNVNSLSQSQIQSFLVGKGSYLANYTTFSGRDNTNVPASQIIYEAAQDYVINPQLILATLQKEESLVTDPSPSNSQLTYAMGYGCPDTGSCSYPGFYKQVDNATWQFRYNYEALNGRAYGGHAASQYPCNSGPTAYYSAPLRQGNTVTFYRNTAVAGSVDKTFVIANAGSASLYCYTPHVGPYSETGYSGSYNFVTSFESWWGSTQTTIPYAWNAVGYAGFTNSSRTLPFNRGEGEISIVPGAKAYLRVQAQNNGNQTWDQSFARLGTTGPQDRCSSFADASWNACNRISMTNNSVLPGEVATFDFSVTAPSTPGIYRECFNMVAENRQWLNDQGVCFGIEVVNQQSPAVTKSDLLSGEHLSPGQYLLSTDLHSAVVVQADGNLVLYNNFKPLWYTGTNPNVGQLIMQTDGNLVLYDKAMKALWASGTDGNTGAYFRIQTDGNAVVYSSSGSPLWWTRTEGYPDGLTYLNRTLSSATLLPSQELKTANGKYRLAFQTDGNVVLYSNSKALWSSQTNGKPAAYLAMQGDGNLVIYDTSYRPLWASGTDRQGLSRLVMQEDGNLVIYNSAGRPTWNTATNGL
jgi:hypothetical protein